MMNVIVIPLFLAASINVQESNWKHGPEVVWNVRIDSVSYPFENIDKTATLNTTMKLNCRSKSSTVLVCRFHEPNVTIMAPNNTGKIHTQQENSNDEYFQLRFDAEGLEDVCVPSSMNPAKLDMIRALVAQLNIGVDLSTVSKNEFEIAENFTTGTCRTKYVLSLKNSIGEISSKPNEVDFVLRVTSGRADIKEITRTRNLNDCLHRVDYFYGSREGYKETTGKFETKVKSSKSRIIMGKRYFTSWTENTIVISDKLNSSGYTLEERLTLSLDKIMPADKPLPTINELATASIFPGKWIHDESSEESSEEKSSSEGSDNSEGSNDFN